MIDWKYAKEPQRRQEDSRSGGLRHDVGTPARIESMKGGSMDGTIHNVSGSGMSLQLPMSVTSKGIEILPVGSRISVIFAPDHATAPADTVRVSAVIARRHPPIIGVRFIDTTREQKHALRMLVVRAVASRVSSKGAAQDTLAAPDLRPDVRPLMSACRKVIEQRLPNMIWTLRTELVTQLRLMRENDADKAPADATRDAELLEQKGTAISRTVERRVVQSFAELSGLDFTREWVLPRPQLAHAGKQPAAQEPAAQRNRPLDASTAMDATCQRMESALLGKSSNVNARLANVLRRRIDSIDNPLAAAGMCRMLWQSVTGFCDSPRVNVCLQRAMVKHITPLLAELYDELEATLHEHGVAAPDAHSSR